jgi:type 1 glutamine amidotransferase
MSKKILIIGISTSSHMNETLSASLMGYFTAHKTGEVTLIGSSTPTGLQPNYFNLATFPWECLSEYDVLVTLGPIRDPTLQAVNLDELMTAHVHAITEFVRNGKGCVAIHLASVQFNEDFTKMLGGHFLTHPPILEFTIQVDDTHHPITKDIHSFTVVDELYITDYDTRSIKILLSATYEGKRHPMTWIKTYGEGKVVYIAPGHDFRTFLNPNFLQLVEQSVHWASHNG